MIYSLDSGLMFDPFDLDIEVTPTSTKKALSRGEYSTAIILSFKLNEMKLKQEILEQIPVSSSKYICTKTQIRCKACVIDGSCE
jgi:periodic tryptophan protein 2